MWLNVDVAAVAVADADDDYKDMRLCEEKRRNGMVMANNIRTNEECVFPLMFLYERAKLENYYFENVILARDLVNIYMI